MNQIILNLSYARQNLINSLWIMQKENKQDANVSF